MIKMCYASIACKKKEDEGKKKEMVSASPASSSLSGVRLSEGWLTVRE